MQESFEKIFNALKPLFLPCKENNFRAGLLNPNFLFCLMLILFALRVVFLPFYFYFPQSIFFAKVISSDITNLLNEERSSLGLSELAWNTELAYAAELKAQDMLEKDYFSHTSPSGEKGWSFVKMAGYDYEVAGENLAIGFLDSSEVHQAWNNSPSHKQNLLSPRFKEVGIAVLTGEFEGRETTVVVQFFGAPIPELPLAQNEIPQAPAATTTISSNVPGPESEASAMPSMPVQETSEVVGITDQQGNAQVMEEPVSFPASLEFNFWSFFANKYSRLAQGAILTAAGALAFVLCLNILALILQPIEKRLKWTIIKNTVPVSIFSILVFIFLASIEKSVLMQTIPHNIKI